MVECITGGASLGQGFETVIAQVCCRDAGRGLSPRARRAWPDRPHRLWNRRTRLARHRDDRIRHPQRGAQVTRQGDRHGGRADAGAPDALDIVDGKVVRKDAAAGPSISLGEIADHLAPTSKSLGEREPGLSAEGWFRVRHQVYPYGIHFAVVRVDRETGGVAVERYVIAYDIGRAINPALVEGQIVGGMAQGVGGSLLEEFTFNERGDPLATTLADYLMPGVRETPPVEVILREDYKSPLNPLGIKGAGESGITGVGAAIASAIDEAIGVPGAITQLPVTPQRLRQLLNGNRAGLRQM